MRFDLGCVAGRVGAIVEPDIGKDQAVVPGPLRTIDTSSGGRHELPSGLADPARHTSTSHGRGRPACRHYPAERWDAVLAVNLSAGFHTIRTTLPGMQARNNGRILNIASVHGLVASMNKALRCGETRHCRADKAVFFTCPRESVLIDLIQILNARRTRVVV
jgi:NAD(P)-dependent dehydrogenase (short-subunit alcohol dehydrogenase family)